MMKQLPYDQKIAWAITEKESAISNSEITIKL